MSTTYKDYSGDPKTIYVKTNVDLSAATVVKVYYIKADGTTGFWTGEYNDRDGDSSNKWIKATVTHSTLTSHIWRLHAYAEFSGHATGHGVYGSVVEWKIYDLGE